MVSLDISSSPALSRYENSKWYLRYKIIQAFYSVLTLKKSFNYITYWKVIGSYYLFITVYENACDISEMFEKIKNLLKPLF